jgi:hypothetical protein
MARPRCAAAAARRGAGRGRVAVLRGGWLGVGQMVGVYHCFISVSYGQLDISPRPQSEQNLQIGQYQIS